MRISMKIYILPDHIINQIAAGEVIERPANVVKELVENAIDAGATKIDIIIANAGKSLIRIIDNGSGIAADQLTLAISRHCTSKLQKDLMQISTLGFRGEALPSIGSVAKLNIISRPTDQSTAYIVKVAAGKTMEPQPVSGPYGTTVEVEDLFFATPARLKFMKSDNAENSAIIDMVKRIAIAFPDISFSLSGAHKTSLNYPDTTHHEDPYKARILQVLGEEFASNMVQNTSIKEDIKLTAYVGLPNFTRANSLHQYIYVNGRPIKDRGLMGAIRAAFMDSLPKDRHGVTVLFLATPNHFLDVNVHPAKLDVRFRDAGLVRGLIISTIRQSLAQSSTRPNTLASQSLVNAFREAKAPSFYSQTANNSKAFTKAFISPTIPNLTAALQQLKDRTKQDENLDAYDSISNMDAATAASNQQTTENCSSSINYVGTPIIDPTLIAPSSKEAELEDESARHYPLGAAKAQLHDNYIIAETTDGLVIVDQHAAHERLIYEELKHSLYNAPLASQTLLIPITINFSPEQINLLLDYEAELKQMGLIVEAFGTDAIIVRATPAILNKVDIVQLINDIIDELQADNSSTRLRKKIDEIIATIACHGSIRSGRILKTREMNALLRSMENTPNSATCNHGRPTYIHLKLQDIERLFGRT